MSHYRTAYDWTFYVLAVMIWITVVHWVYRVWLTFGEPLVHALGQ